LTPSLNSVLFSKRNVLWIALPNAPDFMSQCCNTLNADVSLLGSTAGRIGKSHRFFSHFSSFLFGAFLAETEISSKEKNSHDEIYLLTEFRDSAELSLPSPVVGKFGRSISTHYDIDPTTFLDRGRRKRTDWETTP
jgi:hypothetical protein